MSEAASTLAPHLVSFTATLLMLALTVATNALRKKLNTERANQFLDRLDVVVRDAVLEAEQTTVTHLKAASSDGKLTADEVYEVGAKVLTKVKRNLGEAGLREAKSALGKGEEELDAYLKSKLEAKVANLRFQVQPKKMSVVPSAIRIE